MRKDILSIIISTLALLIIWLLVNYLPPNSFVYKFGDASAIDSATASSSVPILIPKHVKTPESVKAIYMTGYAAGSKTYRDNILKIIDETEINSLVIDVKDYSGKLSFIPKENKEIMNIGSGENKAGDIKGFIDELHKRDVYVIARISVFQDPYMVKINPDWAVKKASNGLVWSDRKGITWIDPGAKPFWDYIVEIGLLSYEIGFDELNFDYIRFPSDGNMKDIKYPWSGARKKSDVLSEFFKYLDQSFSHIDVSISADLFGMTTSNSDDLNIGQVLEDALYSFDYVAPMVYPSHYPKTFNGWNNPAEKPYELIYYVMKKGIDKALFASSSPNKLRPWLQDFDLGADYNSGMVRAQIQATYDAGLNSWMLWDPKNIYTKEALLPYWQGKTGTTTKTFIP